MSTVLYASVLKDLPIPPLLNAVPGGTCVPGSLDTGYLTGLRICLSFYAKFRPIYLGETD